MTAPNYPGELPALPAQVLTEADYAQLGVQASQAGLTASEISNLLAMVERKARAAAEQAARETAMAIVPALLELVRNTHRVTAERIADRLVRQASGGMGSMLHRNCAGIAMDEAQNMPHHRMLERS